MKMFVRTKIKKLVLFLRLLIGVVDLKKDKSFSFKTLKARESNFSSQKSVAMLSLDFEKLIAYIHTKTISKKIEK